MNPKFATGDVIFTNDRYYRVISSEPLYQLKTNTGYWGGYTSQQLATSKISISDCVISSFRYTVKMILNKNNNPTKDKRTVQFLEREMIPLDDHISGSILNLKDRIEELHKIHNFLRNE